jgi:hypothetical protein
MIPGGIIPLWGARSSRNRGAASFRYEGRHHPGIEGRLPQESACEEVHLNLAYRWFCRLGLDGDVPNHSTFSKNRHGRFRESDLLRKLFETVVGRCMKERIVGGDAFAVDASTIVADAH